MLTFVVLLCLNREVGFDFVAQHQRGKFMLEVIGSIADFVHAVLGNPWIWVPWFLVGVWVTVASLHVWFFDAEALLDSPSLTWEHILFPFYLNRIEVFALDPPVCLLDGRCIGCSLPAYCLLISVYLVITVVIWPLRILINLPVLVIIRALDQIHALKGMPS